MNNTLKVIIGVLVVAVLALGALSYYQFKSTQEVAAAIGAAGIGPNHYQAENFLQGLYAGTAGQFRVTATGTVVFGASGTPFAGFKCNTLTWNPTVISSSTVATTTMSLSGYVVGNPAIGSFTAVSSTNEWVAEGKVTATGTSTIILRALPGSAAWYTGLDLGTSTARTCGFQ